MLRKLIAKLAIRVLQWSEVKEALPERWTRSDIEDVIAEDNDRPTHHDLGEVQDRISNLDDELDKLDNTVTSLEREMEDFNRRLDEHHV